MLEEAGLSYEVHAVNLQKDEQLKPEFLAINPNNKIPAIVDRDGPGGKPFSLFESGAILMYLAEKTGKLMPGEIGARYEEMINEMIDITDLYNTWQNGTYPNYGVQLRPVSNDNRWAELYSSDYLGDPNLRPRLVVTP